MILVVLFAVLLMGCSIAMVLNPQRWSKAIITFSEKSYFHAFEIISRALFGIIFIWFSKQTLFPTLLYYMGIIILSVSVVLILIGESNHRKFALWSAITFKKTFRIAGVVSFSFGAFLIYSVLGIYI